MKNVVYIVLFAAVFGSCKSGGSNFTVTGKIKATPSDTVYFQQLSYTSGDMKTIDSAKVDKDGNYTLKGTSEQQNLFAIGFKNNPLVIVVNDASKINMDIDPNGFHYPEISGSEATKELYGFIKDYQKKDSVLSVTYNQMGEITEEQSKDTVFIKGMQQQYISQLSDLANLTRGFINRSNNPASVCFVIDMARNAIPREEFPTLIENAAKRFPQHTGLAAYKTLASAQQQPTTADPNAGYALLNQQAPDLTMPGTDGKTISISNYKGKYVLVDFWASWCAPCRQENPNVVEAYNKFKDKNFAILGVSLDDDKAAWLKAIQDDHLAWTHMSDLQSPSAAATTYHFDGIPFNVLIDPQGKIIAAGLRGPALEQKLNEVLQ